MIAVQQAFVKIPCVCAVDEAQRVTADPGRRDHGHRPAPGYPEDLRAGKDVLEPHHVPLRSGLDFTGGHRQSKDPADASRQNGDQVDTGHVSGILVPPLYDAPW